MIIRHRPAIHVRNVYQLSASYSPYMFTSQDKISLHALLSSSPSLWDVSPGSDNFEVVASVMIIHFLFH